MIKKILSMPESEFLDFKRDYSGNAKDYFHDLLCLANSTANRERYLVFGVSDSQEVVGIDNEIESSHFNLLLTNAPLNQTFSVTVQNVEVNGKKIAVVVIPENPGVPYVLKSVKYGLFPNNVYTRVGCTNTGVDKTADPATIQRIYGKAKGDVQKNKDIRLEKDIVVRFHEVIKDFEGWDSIEEFDSNLDEHVTTYFYKYNMKFVLKTYIHMDDFSEPWAQDAPDSRASAYKIEFLYDGQKIRENYYVATDGGRYLVTYPESKYFSEESKTMYVYYLKDSLNYDLNFVINQGRALYLNRFCNVDIPVFESKEEAENAIEEDFRSGRRVLLSYDWRGHDYKNGFGAPGYERFPKYEGGKPVPQK